VGRGTVGGDASVEGDRNPRVELQEPGVSYLATQENAGSLTLPLSPPPITLEAARTQFLPVVNAGTLATPKPEDRGTNLDPPPPDEAAEPPTQQSHEQIRGLTNEGEPLQSLRGEQTRRAMGQMGLMLARAPEGLMPIGEAHGRPPDFPDPQTQGSTV